MTLRRRFRSAPDVVMVLENCYYPLDARVRLEAESLVDAGMSVEVLAPREPGHPTHETIRGVRVTRFPIFDGQGTLAGTAVEYLVACLAITAVLLPRLARSRHGTLHVHNPPDVFFPLLWLARLRGWSTVFDHHDDAAGLLEAKLGRATRWQSVFAWMRDLSARASDLTITTNDTQRRLVEGVARRVIVVRNSPPVWFSQHRPAAPAGRAKLVFLGEMGTQDGVERTVDILAQLVHDRRTDVELLVIGDGPQRGEVEERAQRLGVSERVEVTGWVPFEDVPSLLASAHVGLDPAPQTEVNHGSTMVKILEYLAVGLPTVASPLRETMVTGGEAVIGVAKDSVEAFVSPIAELLGSPDAWRASAQKAKDRGAELQWPAQAEILIEAYRQLPGSAKCADAAG